MSSALLLLNIKERRALASGAMAPLVDALRSELEPMVGARLPIPETKARLTRIGGRCSFDGTMLAFDPWQPHEHRCLQCQRVFIDRAHDDWWAMGAQLWVAERAAQAAALAVVTADDAMRALALRILDELAIRYDTWPNRDNALGPSRPFFSTYLESIWLINICHAITLLERDDVFGPSGREGTAPHAKVRAGQTLTLDRVRRQLVLPSRNLIATYHEGRSNRQVWDEVAILSASHALGDHVTVASRLNSKRGLYDLLEHGLLADGSWYEGENYHLFAHRGLWYGVEFLRAINQPLPAALEKRYRAGFITPFLGVLPDDTIPSRRDSQYRVSIRQWRFAEWCEMGIAHSVAIGLQPDPRLTGTLQRLYHPDDQVSLHNWKRHPYSTADAERNEPAGLVTRADLSWRSLLMCTAALPEAEAWSPQSVCLPQQGLAVIRRESGKLYVALEGGHTGGGHGHPDRLALTAQYGHARWLEDPGAGSYVERTLNWYRSTLAHAAPLINGASQDVVPAQLLAFEDRGGAGWICKRFDNVRPGVQLQRSVVVCDGYFIDVLEWKADEMVQVDLPIARGARIDQAFEWTPADPGGAGQLEDGFDFLTDIFVSSETSHQAQLFGRPFPDSNFRFQVGGEPTVDAVYSAASPFTVWRATTPGAPGQEPQTMHWLRTRAVTGRVVGVWCWTAHNRRVEFDASGEPTISVASESTEAVHTRTPEGWHIALKARHATSSIDLSYLAAPPDVAETKTLYSPAIAERVSPFPTIEISDAPKGRTFALGEAHYVRTEQSWSEADRPSGSVTVQVDGDDLAITLLTETGPLVVPELRDDNPLDNERRDVNSDGVELFIAGRTGEPWSSSWIAVPAHDDRTGDDANAARVTVTTPGSAGLRTSWDTVQGVDRAGFRLHLTVPITAIPVQGDGTFVMEIIINERPADRARRRGQLVLSGGGGFGYLRGDRSDAGRALTFRLPGRFVPRER